MRAIALEPIWNHHNKTLIEIGDEFEMTPLEVESLIEIGAAEAVAE